MTTPAPDVEAVSSLLREAARDIIVPRFRRLASGDVERKNAPTDPDDLVTVVDRETEAMLTRSLVGLAPHSAVIGEEATHANPALLNLLAADGPLWILDPIDGTHNFVAGDDGFGIMLGYLVGGRARSAWIFFPARDDLFVAEAGSGAFFNGARIVVPQPGADPLPRGVMHVRYMPPALKESVAAASEARFQPVYDPRCAAVEYTEILRGEREFAVYYRLFPWDHAAPDLILSEGGGLSVHLDGRRYTPRSPDQMTIVAGHLAIAERIRGWFAPEETADE